jgi:hypothetical protein
MSQPSAPDTYGVTTIGLSALLGGLNSPGVLSSFTRRPFQAGAVLVRGQRGIVDLGRSGSSAWVSLAAWAGEGGWGMRFLCLLIGEPDVEVPAPGSAEFTQMLSDYQAATEVMVTSGVLVDSGPLQPPASAATLRGTGRAAAGHRRPVR